MKATFPKVLTGDKRREFLTPSKTKANAVHAGLLHQLLRLSLTTPLRLVFFSSYPNSNLLIVLNPTETKVAMEVSLLKPLIIS